MHKLTFDHKNYYLDGQKCYLNSGEFHYFRVPREEWSRRMKLLRESGANALATYIPWRVHEPVEGQFRVDCGDGVTDLSAFLECAAAEGLLVIARPGPYVYSEMVAGGLPDWLLANHPEIMAVGRDGKQLNNFSVSYQHPVFLKYARRFFDFILPVVARHQDDNGGSVGMFQLDNELMGIHFWFGDMDFNPETMGFGNADGRYAKFLASRHGSVARVNELYHTSCGSFADFTPALEPASGIEKIRWNRDYYDFYLDAAVDYLETLADWSRKLGITVPFCHNSAGPAMDALFRKAKQRFGDKLLLGSDHYYMLSQSWAQNNPTPQFMANCHSSLEIMRILGNPPSVFEFQYGNIADWPAVSPEDLEASLMFHIGMGMRGHNGYIFTGGPNPPGDGWTGAVYDYGAPIAADGRPRPTYDALKRVGAFLAAHPEFVDDEPDYDFRILAPWDVLNRNDGSAGAPTPECAGTGELKNDFTRGLISVSFAAGLQDHFVDPDDDGWTGDFSSPLVVSCSGVMEKKLQQKLVRFLRDGGRVLLTPCIPSLDENFEPCALLSEALNGAVNGARFSSRDSYRTYSILGISPLFGSRLSFPATPPSGGEILGTTTVDGQCVAFETTVGRGQLIWLGMGFQLEMNEHIQLWRNLLERLGCERRWLCDNSWLMATRRRTSRGTAIFVANLGTSRQSASASYRDGSGVLHNFPDLELVPMEVRVLFVDNR